MSTDPDWPLADESTAAVLDAAVELGADALWGNRNRNAAMPSSPGPDYTDRLMARVVLGAAAPSIAEKAIADERERIRQLAKEHGATYVMCKDDGPEHAHDWQTFPFADLLGGA